MIDVQNAKSLKMNARLKINTPSLNTDCQPWSRCVGPGSLPGCMHDHRTHSVSISCILGNMFELVLYLDGSTVFLLAYGLPVYENQWGADILTSE